MVDTPHRTGVDLTSSSSVQHPLDPLTPEELSAAVALVRKERQPGERVRFASVALHEPPKASVLGFKEGDPISRSAFIRLLDNADGATYGAIVNLAEGRVSSWQHVPDVQPAIMLDEF